MPCTVDSLIEYVAYQLQDLPEDAKKQYQHWSKEQLRLYVENAAYSAYSVLSKRKNKSKKITLEGPGCVFNIDESDCAEILRVVKAGGCDTPISLTDRQKRQLEALSGCNKINDGGVQGIDFDLDTPGVLVLSRNLEPGEKIEIDVICKTETDLDFDNIPDVLCTKHRAAVFQHVLSEAAELNGDSEESLNRSKHHWEKYLNYLATTLEISRAEVEEAVRADE